MKLLKTYSCCNLYCGRFFRHIFHAYLFCKSLHSRHLLLMICFEDCVHNYSAIPSCLDLMSALSVNIQYVAHGPDEKDANVYFLPQKNSSELKFVLQFVWVIAWVRVKLRINITRLFRNCRNCPSRAATRAISAISENTSDINP